MKINLDKPLVTFRGEKLKGLDKKQILLKDICCEALISMKPNEELSLGKKWLRYELASRLYKGGHQDLRVEEIVEIKACLEKYYLPLHMGAAFTALES